MSKEIFVSFFLYVKEVKDFIVFVIFFCKVMEVCKGVDVFGFGSSILGFIVVFIEFLDNSDGVLEFEGLLLGEEFCYILGGIYFRKISCIFIGRD